MHSWDQQLQHPALLLLLHSLALSPAIGAYQNVRNDAAATAGRAVRLVTRASAGEGHGAGKSRMKFVAASSSRSMRLCRQGK